MEKYRGENPETPALPPVETNTKKVMQCQRDDFDLDWGVLRTAGEEGGGTEVVEVWLGRGATLLSNIFARQQVKIGENRFVPFVSKSITKTQCVAFLLLVYFLKGGWMPICSWRHVA